MASVSYTSTPSTSGAASGTHCEAAGDASQLKPTPRKTTLSASSSACMAWKNLCCGAICGRWLTHMLLSRMRMPISIRWHSERKNTNTRNRDRLKLAQLCAPSSSSSALRGHQEVREVEGEGCEVQQDQVGGGEHEADDQARVLVAEAEQHVAHQPLSAPRPQRQRGLRRRRRGGEQAGGLCRPLLPAEAGDGEAEAEEARTADGAAGVCSCRCCLLSSLVGVLGMSCMREVVREAEELRSMPELLRQHREQEVRGRA